MSDRPTVRGTTPHRTPTRVIVIACSPRSGSSLVAEAFNATGVLGHCDEMLAWDVLFDGPRRHGDRWLLVRLHASKWAQRLRRGRLRGEVPLGRRVMRAYLRRYPDHVMSADGTLTLKLFWGMYLRYLLAHGLDLHHWGTPVVWVRLVRRDRLAQAVSHVRAFQTSQWRKGLPARAAEQFDADAVSYRLQWMSEWDEMWAEHIRASGDPVLEVDYADLDHDYTGTMRRVLDFIGHPELPVPPPQLQRQRDTTTDEWIERYRALHPEYRDPD